MKTYYSYLLVIAIGLFSSCERQKITEITIMSYNIKHGVGNDDSLDLSRALSVIKAQQPDWIALQEIDHFAQRSDSTDQTAFFGEALGMEAVFGEFMPFQGGAYGMAALSAWPIGSTQVLQLPDGLYEPRSSIIQEVLVAEGASILLANVHFDWIGSEAGEKSRSAQATALIEYLDQFDLPTIITGDFNCPPDSPTMELFYKSGFVFAKKGADKLSFQGEKSAEIDHVIFRNTSSMHFTLMSIDLLDEPLVSDHRPLMAKLELTY